MQITLGSAVDVMHVRCRALYRVVLTGLNISAPGVLLDADHWYAVVMGWDDVGWLHYSIASTPVVFVLLCLLWGLVATAFIVGWGNLEPVAVEAPVIELPQLVTVTESAEVSSEDD